MSALFLDLLEGLDALCQTGTTGLPLASVRQEIATSFNPFEDTVDWIMAGRAPLQDWWPSRYLPADWPPQRPVLSPFGLTLSDEARAYLQARRPSPGRNGAHGRLGDT